MPIQRSKGFGHFKKKGNYSNRRAFDWGEK